MKVFRINGVTRTLLTLGLSFVLGACSGNATVKGETKETPEPYSADCSARGREINLSGCDLANVDFGESDLTGANFRDANLTNVMFDFANLSFTDFSGAVLAGATFESAVLFKAKFSNSDIDKTSFGYADLFGADFSSTELAAFRLATVDQDLTGTLLPSGEKYNVLSENCDIRYLLNPYWDVDWSQVEIGGESWSYTDGTGCDLSGVNLQGEDVSIDLRLAILVGAKLNRAEFWNSDLRGADLRNADFRNAKLRGIDLRGANLSGADLRGANFSGANLSGVSLLSARLKGVNFSDANLYRADVLEKVLLTAKLSGAIMPDGTVNP
jgi:uncharacterized protein YjbI with pentapeptide repeats